MKKGFSLVELLAVMVILGVLALITVPAVLNIVNESKSSSVILAANNYLDAVKFSMTNRLKEIDDIEDGTYTVLKNGNICIGNLTDEHCNKELVVNADKNLPKNGFIKLVNGEISTAMLVFEKLIVAKNNEGEVVDASSIVCLPVTSINKTTGNIPKGNFENGDEYTCKVNKKNEYRFFVVGSDENNVNLILNRNINSDGSLTEKQITSSTNPYSAVGWTLLEDYKIASNNTSATKAFTTYGPVTAMNFVTNATKSWDNIPNMNETYVDEAISVTTGLSNSDGTVVYEVTGKARLPKYSEVFGKDKCDLELNSCPLWLVNYMAYYDSITGDGVVNLPKGNYEIYGYWLMSSASDQTYKRYAWYVSYKGNLGNSNIEQYGTRGVRPVITVPKELILH